VRSLVDLASLDLRAAFDFAIMVEEDAQVRYEQLGRLLGDDPGGAGDVFRMMAANEGKHRCELLARRDALFRHCPPRIEISVVGAGVEDPHAGEDSLPRTARAALEVALAAEQRAYAFYEQVLPIASDPEARAFFRELVREEAEHQALLSEKLARLDASAPRVAELAPARGGVAATAEVEACPDRARLRAVIPRFDAATQAVALGVIVEGMAPAEVALALGVSRRTVESKLSRFQVLARRHLAVAIAAAALGGCEGGLAMTDAPARSARGELRRQAADAPVKAGQRTTKTTADAGPPDEDAPDGPEATADGDERASGSDGAVPVLLAIPRSREVDLEFSPGLEEPPQPVVVPAPPPWTPGPEPEASANPAIDDVWPDQGPSSGGARVVIRGKNLQPLQVIFGLTPARIVAATDDALTVEAPGAADAGEVSVVVTNRDGNYAVASGAFRYYR